MGVFTSAAKLTATVSAIAILAGASSHAGAQPRAAGVQSAQQHRFKLPPQPLDGALRTVARVAGAEILFDGRSVAGRFSPALNGDFTVEQALHRLVGSAPLMVNRGAGGAYTIRAASAFVPAAFQQTSRPVEDQSVPPQDAAGANATPDDEEAATEIVVTGIRNSLRAATDEKRSAINIVDVINAEDVGKLPDQNLAEVLENLPGVQIDRNRGVGSGVSIRGSSQNLVLINGRATTPAADARGGISFDDLPAERLCQSKSTHW